jgi:hypothetical protein
MKLLGIIAEAPWVSEQLGISWSAMYEEPEADSVPCMCIKSLAVALWSISKSDIYLRPNRRTITSIFIPFFRVFLLNVASFAWGQKYNNSSVYFSVRLHEILPSVSVFSPTSCKEHKFCNIYFKQPVTNTEHLIKCLYFFLEYVGNTNIYCFFLYWDAAWKRISK